MKTIMLLGSGELGREFAIAAKYLGCKVIAVDNYADAPAMQVSDKSVVVDMLDPQVLSTTIRAHNPDIVVPEIEAIATSALYDIEQSGIQVTPSARAVNLTMNRDHIRNRATELGLRTAKYRYASSYEEFERVAEEVGLPCVVKPVMSSSGKGQSTVHDEAFLESAWKYAMAGMRGDRQTVIVEEFIKFESEITLLTVKQKDGPTLFCQPIQHYQERGDYQWSLQPMDLALHHEMEAQVMAKTITDDLGGAGIFGVEFFITKDEVIFSELSPRPHDTGLVTLHTQYRSEFDLHLRAILGLPISECDVDTYRAGASAVILTTAESGKPAYEGVGDALSVESANVRIFGKPACRKYRRMGVALADTLELAQEAAGLVTVSSK